MKTRPPFHLRCSAAVFAAVTVLFGSHADAQTNYYWDSNGATASFGNSTGTWGTSSFWSTDGNGTSATSNASITTSDTVHFGTATLSYAQESVSGPAAAQGFLNMNFGTGQTTALTISGGTLHLAATSTITQSSTSANMTIGSVLQGSGSALTKTGPGALTLSGNNTFTGGVTLTGNGSLNLAHSSAAGTGTILLKSTQTSFFTTLGLSGGITVANAIQIDSTTGRESAISTGTGNNALTGGITITGGNSSNFMSVNNNQSSGNLTISGGIIGTGGFAGGFGLRGSPAGNTGFLHGVVNTPASYLSVGGATTWTLNTAGSNYTYFFLNSTGNVRLGVDNAIATSAYVWWSANSTTGALDLNGFNQSVAGIQANFAANGNNTVTNNGASDSTLTLAGLTANRTFAGVIKDGATNKVSLVMNSAGRSQTLSGNNTHTGTTSVFGGKLLLSTPLALQHSPFDTSGSKNAGAILDITAATANGTLTLGGLAGAIDLASSNITGFQSVTNLRLNPPFGRTPAYAGAIADGTTARSVTKTGAGTQVLSGNNTYTGATTVSEGTLLIDGSTSSSSPVTVAPGGTLGGCGTIGGPATVSGTLAPTPGGVLRFTAPLMLQASGRIVIRVARSGNSLAHGQIASNAPIPLAGTLVIEDSGTDFLQTGDTIRIFDPATQTTGSFERVVLPSGYSFDSSNLAQGILSVTQGPMKPEFTGFAIQAGTATLSWPEEFKGWWLQLNTNSLDPAGWLDLEGSDSLTSITFALDPSAKSEFYRLRAPRADDLAFAADPLSRGASLTIASVWSGVSPGFSLLTTQNQQIAAYYDANRELVVAARNSNSDTFTTQALGENFTGWDHHNYISAAIDSEGFLHLAADMHNDPMNYFRSSAPVTDAAQFATPGFMQRISPMWSGAKLERCTYPRWFESPAGEFCFNYRDKSNDTPHRSIILRFDPATMTWSQTTGSNSLFQWNDGSSVYHYSVYHLRTRSGSRIHFYYLWTPSGPNYRLGYVRSADMVNWTDAFDRPVALPIQPNTRSETVIDNLQSGGLHNSNPRLTFDRQGNPIIAYHKYDANGQSQIYVAKPDPATQTWKIVQITNSTVRWNLDSVGSASNSFPDDDPLDGLVTLQISLVGSDGTAYSGNGYYTLDENTLENLTGTFPNAWSYAAANVPQSQSSGVDSSTPENSYVAPVSNATMQIPRRSSEGLALSDQQYYLRWESLPMANDKPRTDALGNVISPPPSTMRLYRTWSDFGNSAAEASAYGLLFKPHEARRYGSMALGLDRQAPFRYTLSSSQTGAPHLAEWKFQVPAAGDYALGGFTRLPKPPQAPVRDSSLQLHLDASDSASLILDSAGKVTRWADANRSTNFAEQTTATSRPLKTIDPVLGLPVIDFGPLVTNTANGSWLQFKNALGAALNLSTIRTVIAVMKGSNFLLGDDTNIHFHRGIKPALTPTNPLWHASFTSANIRNGQTFLNGTLINGLTTAMPDSYWLASVITAGNVEASNLARDRSANYNLGGLQVAEMLIYDRPLTEAERLATESYLRKKWLSGLSSGPQQGFLVQIDDTPPVLLPALSYWDYQSAREQDTGGMVRFPLSSGQHTLRVIANTPDAQLGYLWVNRAADTKAPSLCPVAHSGFELVTDPTAVCGYSLRSAIGSDPSGFSASYRIPVPASGNYLLIGRTRAPSTNSNAFQLSIHGAAPEEWNLPVTGTQWAWAPVKTLSGLAAGPITLTVSGGEAGAELDSFLLLKIP